MGAVAALWSGISRVAVDSLSDAELVALAQKGDAESFSELVRRHQQPVYNLALRYMRDPVSAEDLAQEAFLKGFRLIKGFRGDCRFTTWMYRVTSSVCLTEINRRKRRAETTLDEWHEPASDGADVEHRDLANLIRRSVVKLPERYATIVTMYYLEQLPYEEIAIALKIPVGTLKTWMFRARKELRTIVEEELGSNVFERFE